MTLYVIRVILWYTVFSRQLVIQNLIICVNCFVNLPTPPITYVSPNMRPHTSSSIQIRELAWISACQQNPSDRRRKAPDQRHAVSSDHRVSIGQRRDSSGVAEASHTLELQEQALRAKGYFIHHSPCQFSHDKTPSFGGECRAKQRQCNVLWCAAV